MFIFFSVEQKWLFQPQRNRKTIFLIFFSNHSINIYVFLCSYKYYFKCVCTNILSSMTKNKKYIRINLPECVTGNRNFATSKRCRWNLFIIGKRFNLFPQKSAGKVRKSGGKKKIDSATQAIPATTNPFIVVEQLSFP